MTMEEKPAMPLEAIKLPWGKQCLAYASVILSTVGLSALIIYSMAPMPLSIWIELPLFFAIHLLILAANLLAILIDGFAQNLPSPIAERMKYQINRRFYITYAPFALVMLMIIVLMPLIFEFNTQLFGYTGQTSTISENSDSTAFIRNGLALFFGCALLVAAKDSFHLLHGGRWLFAFVRGWVCFHALFAIAFGMTNVTPNLLLQIQGLFADETPVRSHLFVMVAVFIANFGLAILSILIMLGYPRWRIAQHWIAFGDRAMHSQHPDIAEAVSAESFSSVFARDRDEAPQAIITRVSSLFIQISLSLSVLISLMGIALTFGSWKTPHAFVPILFLLQMGVITLVFLGEVLLLLKVAEEEKEKLNSVDFRREVLFPWSIVLCIVVFTMPFIFLGSPRTGFWILNDLNLLAIPFQVYLFFMIESRSHFVGWGKQAVRFMRVWLMLHAALALAASFYFMMPWVRYMLSEDRDGLLSIAALVNILTGYVLAIFTSFIVAFYPKHALFQWWINVLDTPWLKRNVYRFGIMKKR